MGGISLDSFRAMAGGKYNYGSVVLKTDAATGEQTLAKVNNSLRKRDVAVLPAESEAARNLLFSLMSANLRETFGRNIDGLPEFMADLAKVLLGDNAKQKLNRAADGDLAKAFNLFDSFMAKKLTERRIETRVAKAESKLTKILASRGAEKSNNLQAAKQNLNALKSRMGREASSGVDMARQRIDEFKEAKKSFLANEVDAKKNALDSFKGKIKKDVDFHLLQRKFNELELTEKKLKDDVATSELAMKLPLSDAILVLECPEAKQAYDELANPATRRKLEEDVAAAERELSQPITDEVLLAECPECAEAKRAYDELANSPTAEKDQIDQAKAVFMARMDAAREIQVPFAREARLDEARARLADYPKEVARAKSELEAQMNAARARIPGEREAKLKEARSKLDDFMKQQTRDKDQLDAERIQLKVMQDKAKIWNELLNSVAADGEPVAGRNGEAAAEYAKWKDDVAKELKRLEAEYADASACLDMLNETLENGVEWMSRERFGALKENDPGVVAGKLKAYTKDDLSQEHRAFLTAVAEGLRKEEAALKDAELKAGVWKEISVSPNEKLTKLKEEVAAAERDLERPIPDEMLSEFPVCADAKRVYEELADPATKRKLEEEVAAAEADLASPVTDEMILKEIPECAKAKREYDELAAPETKRKLEDDVAAARRKLEEMTTQVGEAGTKARKELGDAFDFLKVSLMAQPERKLDAKKFNSSAFKKLCKAWGVEISEKSFIRVFSNRADDVMKVAVVLRARDENLTVIGAIMKAIGELRAEERVAEKARAGEARPGRWSSTVQKPWKDFVPASLLTAKDAAQTKLAEAMKRLEDYPRRLQEAKAAFEGQLEAARDIKIPHMREVRLENAKARLADYPKDVAQAKFEFETQMKLAREARLNEAKAKLEDFTKQREEARNQHEEPAQDKVRASDALNVKFGDMKSVQTALDSLQAKLDNAEGAQERWQGIRKDVVEGKNVVVPEKVDGENWEQTASRELKEAKADVDQARALQAKERAAYAKREADVARAFEQIDVALRQSGRSRSTVLKSLCKEAGIKIGERSFNRIFDSRSDAVRQTALALMSGSGGALSARNAVVKAVRNLRDLEKAAKVGREKPASLDKTDKALVAFFTTVRSADAAKTFLLQNPSVRGGIENDLLGNLELLGIEPNTDRTLAFTVSLSDDGKKRGAITLSQAADNSLTVGYKGHTFKLNDVDAKALYNWINGARRVEPYTLDSYKNYNPETGADAENTREVHQNWNANLFVPHREVDVRSADNALIDQGKLVSKVDDIIKTLWEENNERPGVYGCSPHFGNQMPLLDSQGSRIVHFKILPNSWYEGRTENFLRTYYNNQIAKSNPLWGGICKLAAWWLDVPLTTGDGADTSKGTVFEKAARYLHGLRLFAQNANYILSQLNTDREGEACQPACIEFNRITQFTVHPTYSGFSYRAQDVADSILESLLQHLAAFDEAKNSGQLDKFFKIIASGNCFNDCMSNMAEFVTELGIDPNDPRLAYDDIYLPAGANAQPVPEQPRVQANAAAPVNGPRPANANAPVNGPRPANVNMPVNGPRPANANAPAQGTNDVAAREKALREFEEKKANGELVIHPDIAKSLHKENEGLLKFFWSEVDALNRTLNPEGTPVEQLRDFSWEKVKPFLQSRLEQVIAGRAGDVARDRRSLMNFQRFLRIAANKEYEQRARDFAAKPLNERQAEWKAMSKGGAKANEEFSLWMTTFFDPRKNEINKAYIPQWIAQTEARGESMKAIIQSNTSLGYVNEEGGYVSIGFDDRNFWNVVEDILKKNGVIKADGMLNVLHGDEVSLPQASDAVVLPDENSLIQEFESRKSANKPVINPTLDIHVSDTTMSSYFRSEISAAYKNASPVHGNEPKVFSWKDDFKPFIKERMDRINLQKRKAAADEARSELLARPAELAKSIPAEQDKLDNLLMIQERGMKYIRKFADCRDDAGRKALFGNIAREDPVLPWVCRFVDKQTGKIRKNFVEAAADEREKWLERFYQTPDDARMKLVEELESKNDPMLSYVMEFIEVKTVRDTDTGKEVKVADFKGEFMKNGIADMTGRVAMKQGALKREGIVKDLFAEVKKAFDAEIAEQRRIVDENKAELKGLSDPEYLKKRIEKAQLESELTLACPEDTVKKLEQAGVKLSYKASALDGYVEVRSYSSEGFWDLAEQLLRDEKVIKGDNEPEFVRGTVLPTLREMSEKNPADYTKIKEVTASKQGGNAFVPYDPLVHGDVTNFLKAVDESGNSVWRTLDGRYEILGSVMKLNKKYASLEGDTMYKEGDVIIPEDEI